jgi:hypothetical protein
MSRKAATEKIEREVVGKNIYRPPCYLNGDNSTQLTGKISSLVQGQFMAKKKQIPELKVLFDTNALYTRAASDLVKPEVAQLVKDNSNYADHKISWYLPDIVRHERQYQMLNAGMDLLPSINKLEKLLGHNLNINKDILENRVKEAVDSQLADLKLNIVEIDVAKVNWNQIMLNAVYRRPPFDPGEREKGFRDALVIESLLQLIAQSPVTPTVCRVVLVSEDKLLSEAAKSVASSSNVRILSTLDELRVLISTLVSEVDENFVAEIQVKAKSYFFEKDDKSTLFYKEGLLDRIKEKFSQELDTKPEGATKIESDAWYIGNPRFVKKEGQRIFCASRIEAAFSGYKFEYKQPQGLFSGITTIADTFDTRASARWANPPLPLISGVASVSDPAIIGRTGFMGNVLTPYAMPPMPPPEKKLVMKYGVIFEIDWSVTLGQHRKFSSPKIENIRYVETQPRQDN